jgi:hypothetical protein
MSEYRTLETPSGSDIVPEYVAPCYIERTRSFQSSCRTKGCVEIHQHQHLLFLRDTTRIAVTYQLMQLPANDPPIYRAPE